MDQSKKKDGPLKNVIIISIGSMLLMAAYLTTAAISQTILQSAREENSSFTADGFISLAIVNITFAVSNFIAPTIVTIIGIKNILVSCSSLYSIWIASFIYPNIWLNYGSSALLGFAAANFWVAVGCFFAQSCTKENIGKYLGINWTIMACGQLFGNAFVFWQFQGSNHIDYETRVMVMSVLTCICIASGITMMFLGFPDGKSTPDENEIGMIKTSICTSITETFSILRNKHMLLLIPPSIWTGLEVAYFGGLFPTTMGFTEAFGGDTRKYVGVAGILIGVGTLTGGLIFGAFGEKLVKSNRSIIVSVACFSFCLSAFLIFVNHPNSASLGPTKEVSWIDPPSIPISMFIAFLLGLGDGCIMPQITAAIGVIWPENPSAALAVFRFFMSSTCATAFYLGTLTGLYKQLIIFVCLTIAGAITYILNELLIQKNINLSATLTNIKVLSKKVSCSIDDMDFKGK